MERPPICQCRATSEIMFGVDDYARGHLSPGRVYLDEWAAEYICPTTGTRWLRDQPHGELHGGGPPRLRTADRVAADLNNELSVVEFLFPEDDEAVRAAEALAGQLAIKYGTPGR
jgi:hypothetical protein